MLFTKNAGRTKDLTINIVKPHRAIIKPQILQSLSDAQLCQTTKIYVSNRSPCDKDFRYTLRISKL